MQDIYQIHILESKIALEQVLPTEFHEFHDVFLKSASNELPPHHLINHYITLEGEAKPGYTLLYNMLKEELDLVRKFINENLSKGFITTSLAPFASPMLFVKKADGSLRFYVDYRKLNAITKKDRYPIPLIKETLAQVTGVKFITKIDIRHAFNQVRMQTEEDEDLTTFRTCYESYKSRVMPFGLTNGLATF